MKTHLKSFQEKLINQRSLDNVTMSPFSSQLSAASTVEAIQLSGCQTRDKNHITPENNEQISLLPTSTLSVVAKVSH